MKVPLSKGIEYLGYKFCLANIEVRPSSMKKMFANLMKILTGIKYKKSGKQLWRLNLRVTGCQINKRRVGWLFFFSQSKNLQQLKQLDAFIATHAKNVLLSAQMTRLKRFVKAYHEIRFHAATTNYVLNFDAFTAEEKKAQIAVLLPKKTAAELDALGAKELDDLFKKCIGYELADLEQDMMEVFS